jgi:hypothetical protein
MGAGRASQRLGDRPSRCEGVCPALLCGSDGVGVSAGAAGKHWQHHRQANIPIHPGVPGGWGRQPPCATQPGGCWQPAVTTSSWLGDLWPGDTVMTYVALGLVLLMIVTQGLCEILQARGSWRGATGSCRRLGVDPCGHWEAWGERLERAEQVKEELEQRKKQAVLKVENRAQARGSSKMKVPPSPSLLCHFIFICLPPG